MTEKKEDYESIIIQGAYHGADDLKLTKDGFEIKISVDMIVGGEFASEKKYKDEKFMARKLQEFFYHELLHAYEDVHRKMKDETNQLSDTSYQIYAASASALRQSMNLPEYLSTFLYLVYAAASFEVSARNSQVWPTIKNISDFRQREEKLKKTDAWHVADLLEKFSYKTLMADMKDDVDRTIKETGDKLELKSAAKNVVNLVKEFFIDAEHQLSEYSIKKILNNKIDISPSDVMKVSNMTEKHAKDIASISNDPETFFKHWETIFHIAGHKAKRKMAKMITAES